MRSVAGVLDGIDVPFSRSWIFTIRVCDVVFGEEWIAVVLWCDEISKLPAGLSRAIIPT